MSKAKDRFADRKYVGWLKVQISLMYAKDGLEPITEDRVQAFHLHLLRSLPDSSTAAKAITCRDCKHADFQRQWNRGKFFCVNGICDQWLTLLQQELVNPAKRVNVCFDKIDVSKFPENPWECIKLYLPYVHRVTTCVADADLISILHLYQNCKFFASSLKDADLCKKVQCVRNEILHSGTMQIDTTKMHSDIDVIRQLLNDPAFAADKACQEASDKIVELLQSSLDLTLNREVELKVILAKQVDLETAIRGIKQKIDENAEAAECKMYTEVLPLQKRLDEQKYEQEKLEHMLLDMNTDVDVLKRQTADLKQVPQEKDQPVESEKSKYWPAFQAEDHETAVQQLIDKGVLPTQSDLQYACTATKPNTFEKLAEIVRSYILSQSSLLKKVNIAYHPSKREEIVFIVFAEDFDINIPLPYTTVFRRLYEYSSEGMSIMNSPEMRRKPFTEEESASITKALKENSKKLMEEHSNIQVISACSVKSKNYGKYCAKITPTTCIVLYVDVKGLIPLNESSLPEELNDIPVDVREGSSILFSDKGPREEQTPLRMGCQISTEVNSGTLGAFVEEDSSNTLYCLTCAHAVVRPEEVKQGYNGTVTFTPESKKVFQPTQSPLHDHQIGYVEKAVLREGGGGHTGVDIALIKVTSRVPQTGEFPAGDFHSAGFDAGRPMVYTSGIVYERMPDTYIIGSELVKFGAASGPTRGNLHVYGSSAKRITQPMDFDIRLFNQIEVISRDSENSRPFAERGDSGALVFVPHQGDCSDLRALGILEGGTSYGTVLITPIWEVLKALNMPFWLKSFPSHPVQEVSIASAMADLSLQSRPQPMHQSMEEDRIEVLRQDLSQEMARQTSVTQTRMDVLEQKIDRQHDELKELIKSMREDR